MRANLLIDSLPNTVEVGGREFSINSDFRTSVLFELLIYDDEVKPESKVAQIFDLYFDGNPDVPRTKEAIDAILAFYRCEKRENKAAKRLAKRADGGQQTKRIYDFEHDDTYIYAAFMSEYGINLNSIENLHWWKFSALFSSLGDEQKICKIMGYRAADLSKIKNKQERERMARLKVIYALPNNASKEEKIAHAASIFAGGINQ